MWTMTPQDIVAAWPIDGPVAVHPLLNGTNNRSYSVVAPGARYILRLYQNTTAPERVRYEHALLARLARATLPFAVPAPLPTHSGATLVAASPSDDRLAALFHVIPGRRPDGRDLAQYRICGAALADLDHAFAHIALPPLPRPLPPFGDLSHLHRAIPDPIAMVEELPLEPNMRTRIAHVVGDVVAVVPDLYQSLPCQIVHRDYAASNVLIDGERITGVLDFEFAGRDLRAIDLARSLCQFTTAPWSHPEGWRRVIAFISGYHERVTLRADEVDALPDLMRLYRIVSLIHREGRRRQRLASATDVQVRADALLQQHEWLRMRWHDLSRVFTHVRG